MQQSTEQTALAQDTTPIIQMESISKRYGAVQALDSVDFHIGQSEIVGLLGENGAGKSTLIKILSGIVEPDSGTIRCDGEPVRIKSHKEAYQLGIETIYQDMGLVDDMTIARNIFLGRELTGALGFMKMKQMRETAMEALQETIGITGIVSADQVVRGLSGGQKQSVAIARAVHFKNRILLLDEPTSALSVRETNKTLEYTLKLKSDGISSVLVSHNLYHAYQVADRFVVLSHGKKLKDCRRDETSIEELTKLIVAT
jgi:simple sugar transport system ATP-binding protein